MSNAFAKGDTVENSGRFTSLFSILDIVPFGIPDSSDNCVNVISDARLVSWISSPIVLRIATVISAPPFLLGAYILPCCACYVN